MYKGKLCWGKKKFRRVRSKFRRQWAREREEREIDVMETEGQQNMKHLKAIVRDETSLPV